MTACNKKRNLQYFNQQSAKGPEKDSSQSAEGPEKDILQTAEGPEEYTHFKLQRDLRKTLITISRGT
jgi:hypothetical protein